MCAMNVTQLNLLPSLKSLPKFYQEVMLSFNKTKAKSALLTREEMLMQPLWGNSNVTYFNKSTKQHEFLTLNAWNDSGMTHVADIEIKNGQILEEFLYAKISNHSISMQKLSKLGKP